MSSPLSVKRRRLNDSTKQLTKPFVSPLRASKSDSHIQAENKDNGRIHANEYLPSTLAHTTRVPPPLASKNTKPFTPARSNLAPIKSKPIHKQIAYTASAKRKDPVEFQAERAITAMEMRIRSVKNDIDTLNQATQISSSNNDADLEVLIQKWKHVSQQAAEELFGTVKERVNRMGGVAAWRESEKKKFDRSHGLGEFKEEAKVDDDADCEFDSEGEELPEEEQEWRKKCKREARREMMEAADVDEEPVEEAPGEKGKVAVWQEGGKDDDEFTIDMMLRSLNIELGVIGYDKVAQRWVA